MIISIHLAKVLTLSVGDGDRGTASNGNTGKHFGVLLDVKDGGVSHSNA